MDASSGLCSVSREDLPKEPAIIVNSGPGTLGDAALRQCLGHAGPQYYIFSGCGHSLPRDPPIPPVMAASSGFCSVPREDLPKILR